MADTKDRWDKINVILQPMGGLLTALAVAWLGFFGSKVIGERQELETNTRLYADLMSKREESDSSMRKEMFNSIIGTFLTPRSAGPEQRVLNLELLAYNFHEALDLGPLFKQVSRDIKASPSTPINNKCLERLEAAARDVADKQVAALEEAGGRLDGAIPLEDLTGEGKTIIDAELPLHLDEPPTAQASEPKRHFVVEALYAETKRKEIRLKLEVTTVHPPHAGMPAATDQVVRTFWVGFFDFPMIDNVRLSHGQRCAIVLRVFPQDPSGEAQITLVNFPGSRASLKDKPFYDEVRHELLKKRESAAEEESN